MTSLRLTRLIPLAAVAAMTLHGASAAFAPVAWKKFVSTKERFSVSFPGTPTRRERKPGPESKWKRMVTYRVVRDEVPDGFNVDVAYMPSAVTRTPVETVLDGVGRSGGSQGTRVRAVKKLRMAGHPAREVIYDRPGIPTPVMRSRVLLVGTRLFIVSVVTTAADQNSPKVERFFNSFDPRGPKRP